LNAAPVLGAKKAAEYNTRMTWKQLARCQRLAAQFLLAAKDGNFDRPICSRAYYASYAVVTSRLPPGTSFARGWTNPQHAKLPAHVASIGGLRDSERQAIRRALRRLRQRREDADYRPGITIDATSARESMRDAAEVFAIFDRA
jgi:hypothetical protein